MIPALNRDGDILSDLVLPLFGSIAGSESMLVAFDEEYVPRALMAEAAHGTAPSLFGKDVANPMAMILAGAALLSHADEAGQQAGRAIREATLEAVAEGCRTADLGGHAGSREFTDEVIRRTTPEARGLVLALDRDADAAARRPDLAVPPALDERARQLGVELGAGAALQLDERLVDGERRSVRARRGHGVEGVGDAEQPCLERDPVPAQPVRIAAAVPALVVVEHVRQRGLEVLEALDEPCAR